MYRAELYDPTNERAEPLRFYTREPRAARLAAETLAAMPFAKFLSLRVFDPMESTLADHPVAEHASRWEGLPPGTLPEPLHLAEVREVHVLGDGTSLFAHTGQRAGSFFLAPTWGPGECRVAAPDVRPVEPAEAARLLRDAGGGKALAEWFPEGSHPSRAVGMPDRAI